VITFRYHIVSIVSVFLALAIGVALGAGPLKGEVDNTLVEQVEADRRAKNDLQAEINALRNTNQFVDDFARNAAPAVSGQALEGRVVNLIVLPDASDSSVESVTELIAVAGGTIGGTLLVGEGLLDPSNRQLVDELASQLLDGTSDVSVADEATGYERMGALIARAVGTTEDGGAPVDSTSSSILAGLSTAGLMSADGDVNQRGSLVLVVAGPGPEGEEERQGANSIVTSLAASIDANTEGVVVAGPVAAARDDHLLEAIRSEVAVAREVSTVGAFDRTAGNVVGVLALQEQARGETGHYGAVNAPDGAMPGALAPRR